MSKAEQIAPSYTGDGPNMLEVAMLMMVGASGGGLPNKADKILRAAAVLHGCLDQLFIQHQRRGTNVYLTPVNDPPSVVTNRKDELVAELADCLALDTTPRLVTNWVNRLDGGLISSKYQFKNIVKKTVAVLEHKEMLSVEKRALSDEYILLQSGLDQLRQLYGMVRRVLSTSYEDDYAVAVTTVFRILDPQLHSLQIGRSKENEAYNRLEFLFQNRPVHRCLAETFGIWKGWGILWYFDPRRLIPPMPW
eukprot:CFRG6100T1